MRQRGMLMAKTWTPQHGIVFSKSTLSSSESRTTASSVKHGEVEQLSKQLGSVGLTEEEISDDGHHATKVSPVPQQICKYPSLSRLSPTSQSPGTRQNRKKQVPPDIRAGYATAPGVPTASLAFQIPESVRQEAEAAEQDSESRFWRYELYRNAKGDKPSLHLCRTKEAAERIAQMFLDEPILGFDLEWKSNVMAWEGPKQNVSLIQIASEERIALFQLASFRETAGSDLIPKTLRQILESPEVTKAGVAIKADCTRLRKFLGVQVKGIFELSHLYKLVKFSSNPDSPVNKRLVRLSVQVEELLGLPLYKGHDVRASDWARQLSMSQLKYAASDSYASFRLFHALEDKRRMLVPVPPCPAFAEHDIPIRLADGASIDVPADAETEDFQDDAGQT